MLELLNHQIEVLKLSRQLEEQTKEKIDERQREFYLREQMKAIRTELGEGEEGGELEDLRKAVAEAKMPEEAAQQAAKELKRLERMPEESTEYSMVRTYLDWLIALPWSKLDAESIDIARAREILDEDHFGLPKVKQRILEYLAVRKLNPGGPQPDPVLRRPARRGQDFARPEHCPGAGPEIRARQPRRRARRSGDPRPPAHLHRFAAGQRHPADPQGGHAQSRLHAGRDGQARRQHARRPVLGAAGGAGPGAERRPSATTISACPSTCAKVFFLGTANVLDTIPGPLRDRMEIIELPGYTQEEKLEIARRYLVKRQLKANGLSEEQARIDDDALREIISSYTREAGVRNLEREIGSVLRNVAVRISEGKAPDVHVTREAVAEILGAQKFEFEVALRTSTAGVATGLAWTPVGGDILFVEATAVRGKGGLILTGQLGDVMKESAQAAVTPGEGPGGKPRPGRTSASTSTTCTSTCPPAPSRRTGPSAGVALFTSVCSLLTNRKVRSDVAMTGEISLRGLVLPVGGIKEKALAALRAGIHTVLLPARNRKDLEEIPESARAELEFVWLETVDDALRQRAGELTGQKDGALAAWDQRGSERGAAAPRRAISPAAGPALVELADDLLGRVLDAGRRALQVAVDCVGTLPDRVAIPVLAGRTGRRVRPFDGRQAERLRLGRRLDFPPFHRLGGWSCSWSWSVGLP